MPKRSTGFTLIELLIVISIIILLLVYALINVRGQINKAQDAKRKSDLFNLRSAIEEYRNDHDAFPPAGTMTTCGGSGLSPYLAKIPCDPTGVAYGYFLSASTGGYRVCTVLLDTSDPAIEAIGCGGTVGCGLGGGYNYCLAQGTTASAVGTADAIIGGGAPTPTPFGATPGVSAYACTPADSLGHSVCSLYSIYAIGSCPVTFDNDPTCNNQCQVDPTVRCRQ